MKNLVQQFSEYLMITRSSKPVRDSIPVDLFMDIFSRVPAKSVGRFRCVSKFSKPVRDSIPVDLLMDIFSRVPAKSVGRFRCVSKFWESILACSYFTELFLTKSLTRPRIIFAFIVNRELFVFSSPQPQNPAENSSDDLVATPYKGFPKWSPSEFCYPLYGLVFLPNVESDTPVFCNPITGESIILPEVVKAMGVVGKYHFGFDPVNKQFKVLCTTWSGWIHGKPISHHVLTLETGKSLLWRPIQNPLFPHSFTFTGGNDICINGVVYYQAFTATSSSHIMCFDFRSESFSLINMTGKGMVHERRLVLFNYKGHLCGHQLQPGLWEKIECFFWLLEDAVNHKWSKRTCGMLPFGKQIVKKHRFVGITDTGELVFSPIYLSKPFYIFYYNIEKKICTRFNIQGFPEFNHQHIHAHTSLDYIENFKFM